MTAPLVVHIADQDEFFPAEGRAKTVAALKGRPTQAAMSIRTPITPSPASAAFTGTAAPPRSPTGAAPRHWCRRWDDPHPVPCTRLRSPCRTARCWPCRPTIRCRPALWPASWSARPPRFAAARGAGLGLRHRSADRRGMRGVSGKLGRVDRRKWHRTALPGGARRPAPSPCATPLARRSTPCSGCRKRRAVHAAARHHRQRHSGAPGDWKVIDNPFATAVIRSCCCRRCRRTLPRSMPHSPIRRERICRTPARTGDDGACRTPLHRDGGAFPGWFVCCRTNTWRPAPLPACMSRRSPRHRAARGRSRCSTEYRLDAAHLAEYARLARTEAGFAEYLRRFVSNAPARAAAEYPIAEKRASQGERASPRESDTQDKSRLVSTFSASRYE